MKNTDKEWRIQIKNENTAEEWRIPMKNEE